jgi:hypothetical protein
VAGLRMFPVDKLFLILKYKFKLPWGADRKFDYWVLVVFACGVLIILLELAKDVCPGSDSLSFDVSSILLLYFYLDCVMSVMIYQRGFLVEIDQLYLFPISRLFFFVYLLFEMMFDIKSILFIATFLLLLYKIFSFSITAGISSFVLFGLFFLLCQVWILNIYILFMRQFEIFRKNLGVVLIIPYAIYWFMNDRLDFGPGGLIEKIPVIGSIGRSISLALDNLYFQSFIWGGIILFLIAFGVLLGTEIIGRKEYK